MTYEIQIWGRLHPEQSCVGNDETITPLQGDDLASYEGILRNHLESMATRPELYSRDQLQNDKAFYGRLLNLLALDKG